MAISDWYEWHQEYDEPGSELAERLRLVQKRVATIVDACPSGTVTVVSICAGQGRELIAPLEHHPRASDVRGLLVELNPANVAEARRRAQAAGLDNLEVLEGDAGLSENYLSAGRASLVVVSGVFGQLSMEDVVRTITLLTEICKTGGSVIRTTYEVLSEKQVAIEGHFADHAFEQVGFELTSGKTYGVVQHRYRGEPQPLSHPARIFTYGSSHNERETRYAREAQEAREARKHTGS